MSYLTLKDFIQRLKLSLICKKNKEKFLDFFDNKTIAIVGNATSLFNSKFGEAIDSHDIIIRFNNGYIKNPDSQGSKTTIWASSLFIEESELIKMFPNLQHIIWLTPKMSQIKKYSLNILNIMTIYPFFEWYKLYKKLNKNRPTSGAMLIDYLIKNTNYKYINIYGFDFFQTNSFYNNINLDSLISTSPHQFNIEKNYIIELIKNSKEVSLNN